MENMELASALKRLRRNAYDTEAMEILLKLAADSRDAKYWLGVNYFFNNKLEDNIQQSKKIFAELNEDGDEDAKFWLGLLNYPLFVEKADLNMAVQLWSEEEKTDRYGNYWLAQYNLDPRYGKADYYEAWDCLKNPESNDKGAAELILYLMTAQEFSYEEYDEMNRLNDVDYWLERVKQIKLVSPYGTEEVKGKALKNYAKAYVNDRFGEKLPVEVPTAEEREEIQEELAAPSPYRGISFILSGVFLVIFVVLTIIHVLM